jgi:methylated-DNA-protein-cysteine methyltransferase related protein
MVKLRSTNHQKKTSNEGFFEMVYEVTRLIPYGRVTSYGAIAKYLGSAQSARMVGWALNSSHSGVTMIPAHRVVNRNGELSGKVHFGGANVMQQLLESEGIAVKNDTVIHFKKLFWDPGKELVMSKEY